MPNNLPIIYVYEDDLDGLERSGAIRAPVFDTPKAGTVSFEHIGHCLECKYWELGEHWRRDCWAAEGPSTTPPDGTGFCHEFEAKRNDAK